MFMACRSPLRKAEVLIEKGSLLDAERLLVSMHNDRPNDEDVSLLLGHVYLLEQRADVATAVLQPLANASSKLAPRIAQDFETAATEAARIESISNFTHFAATAAQIDPTMHRDVCRILIGRLQPARSYWREVAITAAAVDHDCQKTTLQTIRSWIDNANAAEVREQDLEAYALTAGQIDSDSLIDFAHAIRDLAQRTAASDRDKAARILDAACRADPDVKDELETVVLRSSIGGERAETKGANDETQMFVAQYSGDPLEATRRTVKQIGDAVFAYEYDHNRYPEAHNIEELKSLVWQYLRGESPSLVDAWGTRIAYVGSRGTARVISGGADRHIDAESYDLGKPLRGTADEYGADIVWQNGSIQQQPSNAAVHKYDGAPVSH
jgi:hypothetical protein